MRVIVLAVLFCGLTFATCTSPCVQEVVATDPAGDATGGFTANTTTGNSLIAVISHLSTTTLSPGAVSQGAANNLALAVKATVAGVIVEIWYVHNITGGTKTIEALTDEGSGRISLNMFELTPLTNGGPEATNTKTAVLSSTVTTNSVTPASASNLVVAVGGWTANDYSSGPTNSFVRLTQTGGGAVFQEGAYLVQASAIAASTGWGLTAGVNWATAIAVFGAPPSGPTNAQRSAGFFMAVP